MSYFYYSLDNLFHLNNFEKKNDYSIFLRKDHLNLFVLDKYENDVVELHSY
ncbi:hypothetical protein J582_2591 [Acinetobacter sp. 1566109]|nr:hypothetical protein J582_2591 [Acinetobacter sp. 1566109]